MNELLQRLTIDIVRNLMTNLTRMADYRMKYNTYMLRALRRMSVGERRWLLLRAARREALQYRDELHGNFPDDEALNGLLDDELYPSDAFPARLSDPRNRAPAS